MLSEGVQFAKASSPYGNMSYADVLVVRRFRKFGYRRKKREWVSGCFWGKGGEKPTVFESCDHRDESSIECVSVVVYACCVHVKNPDRFAWMDAERLQRNDARTEEG